MSRDFSLFPVPALDAAREVAGGDPRSNIYFSRDGRNIVICANSVIEKGLYIEQKQPKVLAWDCGNEELGQATWESLLRANSASGVNLRSVKTSDWPAFRASGSKTIRAFEDEFVRVLVRALAGVLEIEAPVPGAEDLEELYVGRRIAPACDFETLGRLIRFTCKVSVSIAEHGPK